MDPIGMFVGVALFVGGWLAGRVHWRRGRTSELSSATLCSCGHGYGIHAEGKACGAEVKRAASWNHYAQITGYEWVPCPCQSYDGPEPLPRVWTE